MECGFFIWSVDSGMQIGMRILAQIIYKSLIFTFGKYTIMTITATRGSHASQVELQ